MTATRVKKYLKSQKTKYKTLKHSPVFTAQEVAASAHIPGRQLAKSVMIKLERRWLWRSCRLPIK